MADAPTQELLDVSRGWQSASLFELRCIRSLARRLANAYGKHQMRRLGVVMGERIKLCGLPLISMVPGSEIAIGADVDLISWSQYNPIGVNHPVILRTLRRGARLTIGESTGISGASICAARLVEIGPRCLVGANVMIADTDFHPIAPHNRRYQDDADERSAADVRIGANVFLGAGAIILKGVTIGENTVIGAGSVVCRPIPANVIAAGNPCRVVSELRA